jgi:hypothetical protein
MAFHHPGIGLAKIDLQEYDDGPGIREYLPGIDAFHKKQTSFPGPGIFFFAAFEKGFMAVKRVCRGKAHIFKTIDMGKLNNFLPGQHEASSNLASG